jgi:hypothetical protein
MLLARPRNRDRTPSSEARASMRCRGSIADSQLEWTGGVCERVGLPFGLCCSMLTMEQNRCSVLHTLLGRAILIRTWVERIRCRLIRLRNGLPSEEFQICDILEQIFLSRVQGKVILLLVFMRNKHVYGVNLKKCV